MNDYVEKLLTNWRIQDLGFYLFWVFVCSAIIRVVLAWLWTWRGSSFSRRIISICFGRASWLGGAGRTNPIFGILSSLAFASSLLSRS